MNELVRLGMPKTGLPRYKAQEAVDVMIGHRRARLSDSVHSHLDTLLAQIESPEAQSLIKKSMSFAVGLGSKVSGHEA